MRLFTFISLLMVLFANVIKAEGINTYEEKARKALEQIVKEQIERIKDISNTTSSSDENNIRGYVLSTHIRVFSDIAKSIDNEIHELREQIRLLIRRVATDIEITGGNSGVLEVGDDGHVVYTKSPNLPNSLNEKRQKLMEANLQNSVSVRSAALAIRLLAGINDGLKASAYNAKTRQQKEKIYMAQAIYVYEMADITVELLEGLALEGKAAIYELYDAAKNRVNSRIQDIDSQLDKVKELERQQLLSVEQATKEEETYLLMRKANIQSLDAWGDLIATVGKQEEFLTNLKRKIAIIEYKREKARVQLETLRDLRQVAELRDTIGSLDDLVVSVASLDLLVLDERTVQNLLGYDIGE